MGRAMLIICAGVLMSLGYIAISTSGSSKSLASQTSEYAKQVHAQNAASTAIQIAFNKMNEDPDWAGNHEGAGNAWTSNIQGASTTLYLDKYEETADYFEPDSIRIVSTAKYLNTEQTVISLYLKNAFEQFVPDFPSPLAIATNNFTFSAGGSSSISGNAPDGCPEDKPAVTTMTGPDSANVHSSINDIDVTGDDPLVKSDPDLSYQPTDDLIARLRNADSTKTITGSYKGEMGTKDDPGVFFVKDKAKLTGGISEGYGILIVDGDGELGYEDETTGEELDIAGNFTFNGLVIFENAFSLKGNGTPTINGSVLIGNTDDSDQTIDIDINGNLHLQYDCKGEDYAKQAAAQAIQQNKYTRVVTYQ